MCEKWPFRCLGPWKVFYGMDIDIWLAGVSNIMKFGRLRCFYLFFAGIFMALTVFEGHAAAANSVPADFAYEVAVEQHLEERLTGVLEDIVGTDRAIAVVDAEVANAGLEPSALRRQREKDALALPGVPVKKKYGMEGGGPLNGDTVNVVTRISATILLDDDVDDDMESVVTKVGREVIGFNEKRGDQLKIERVDLGSGRFRWGSVLHPPHLYWMSLVLAGAGFLLAAAIFLLNPYKKLSGALQHVSRGESRGGGSVAGEGSGGLEGVRSAKGAVAAAPAIETHSVSQAGLVAAETRPPAAETSAVDGETPLPFSFIDARNIGRLTSMFRDRPPHEIAVVMNYLPPELGIDMLERFPEDRQVEIALKLSESRELDPENVRVLEDDVKKRLDYLMGEEDKLLTIIDGAGEDVRDKFLEMLKGSDPELAQRIRKRVRNFETILTDIPPEGILLVYRRLDPSLFAQLLNTVPDSLREKVFSALSSGAVERLKQEMEMSRPLTAARVKREKRNVVTMIRRMIKEGLIEED